MLIRNKDDCTNVWPHVMICMHTSPTASGQAMLTVSASSGVGACYSFSNVAFIWEPCRPRFLRATITLRKANLPVLRGRLRKNRPLIFFSKINLASNFSYLLDLTSILQNHIQNFLSHVISRDF
jgi:hypothetical protein